MEIQVICPQGHRLTAREKLFGKSILCPKCKEPVQIPIPNREVAEPGDIAAVESGPSRSPVQPETPAADPFDPFVSIPQAADPLAGGPLESSPQSDPLAGDLSTWESLGDLSSAAESSTPPTMPVSPVSPAARSPKSGESADRQGQGMSQLLVCGLAAGGGLLLGLLFVTLFAWWFYRESGPVAAAASPPESAAPTDVATTSPPPPSSSVEGPSTVAAPGDGPGSPPPSVTVAEVKPQNPAGGLEFAPLTAGTQPLDLQSLKLDPRLVAYALPGNNWASAYDASSGRVVITNDQAGFILYDLDDLATGKPTPVATIPCSGFPTAVCFKLVKDKLWLLVATKDAPSIRIHDAQSLQLAGEVRVERAAYVNFLAGSSNPQDPFVYYCTEPGDPDRWPEKIETTTADCVGRINLETMKWDGQTGGKGPRASEVIPSADGELLYTRHAAQAGSQIWASNWTDKRDANGFTQLVTASYSSSSYTSSLTPDRLGLRMASGYRMFSRMCLRSFPVEYEVKAFFREQPLVAGIREESIVLGSANNLAMLAQINLPADWFPVQSVNSRIEDARQRPMMTVSRATPFLSVEADDARRLALYVLKNQLIVVPLSRLQLPVEESLLATTRPPYQVKVGEHVTVALGEKPSQATFEWITKHSEAEVNREYGRVPLGSQPTDSNTGRSRDDGVLTLNADVTAGQSQIFVSNVEPILDRPFPQIIQIGDEEMSVVAVDRYRNALKVRRNAGKRHEVTESVVRVAQAAPASAARSSQPEIRGREFHWSPNAEQLGAQTLHMRATSGNLQHDWYWDVMVEHPTAPIPFYVLGAELSLAGDLAVVWGRSPPEDGKSLQDSVPTTHFIGTYDVAQRTLSKYRELSAPVLHAAIDRRGVFASIGPATNPGSGTEAALPTIIHFDLDKLEVANQVTVDAPCSHVELIGPHFLAARGQSMHRFLLPDLKPVPVAITPQTNQFPVAARLGDKWLWDGVIWEPDLTTPRLILFPLLFGMVPKDFNRNPHAEPGAVLVQPAGRFACTFTSSDTPDLSALRAALPDILPPGASPDVLRTELRGSVRGGIAIQTAFGKMYVSPFEPLPTVDEFRFEERQSTLVLATDTPNTVAYSVTGAAKYQLILWVRQPDGLGFDQEFVLLNATSTTGSFEITIPADDKLLSQMQQSASSSAFVGPAAAKSADEDPVRVYTRAILPGFRALLGRAPQGVPLPVYALVFAESADGFQRAGLAHSYLVEVPVAKYQDFVKRISQR